MRKAMKCSFFILILLYGAALNVFSSNSEEDSNTIKQYDNMFSIDTVRKPMVTPNSIAVDSDGNLYIVNMLFGKIQVYNNNKYVYSYTMNSDSPINLKIDQEDTLYLFLVHKNIGLEIKNKQLVGVVNDYQSDDEYRDVDSQNNECTDVYGNYYKMHGVLGYDYVTKTTPDGKKDVIYSIPKPDFMLKLFLGLCFLLFVFFVLFVLVKYKSAQKAGGQSEI